MDAIVGTYIWPQFDYVEKKNGKKKLHAILWTKAECVGNEKSRRRKLGT